MLFRSDICEYVWKSFDAVIATYVLHHLETSVSENVISQMKMHTKSHGVNVVALYTNEGALHERSSESGLFYPQTQLLRKLYLDWHIIEYKESTRATRVRDEAGRPIENMVTMILAKKPCTTNAAE